MICLVSDFPTWYRILDWVWGVWEGVTHQDCAICFTKSKIVATLGECHTLKRGATRALPEDMIELQVSKVDSASHGHAGQYLVALSSSFFKRLVGEGTRGKREGGRMKMSIEPVIMQVQESLGPWAQGVTFVSHPVTLVVSFAHGLCQWKS